jgi:pilus assembly protein CpaE
VTAPAGRKIRVLIVDDVADTRENVKKLLLFERDIEVVGAAADGAHAIEAAKQLKPDAILMDINMPGMDGIAAAEAISVQVPQSQVIMMSVQAEADYLRRSMLAGAREFLIKPFTGDELVEAIRRVYELGAAKREASAAHIGPSVAPTAPAAAGAPAGQVIAVFSPKGGTGRTIVATNLAVALKMLTGKKVTLVDCSLQFGDVAVLLNLTSNKSIVDAMTSSGDVDTDLLDDVLLSHSSGIRVLLAPPRPEMSELVTTEFLKKILIRLRTMNDYVVVDTWNSFHDQVLAVLDLADHILLLTTSELPTIKNVRLFLEVAEALGYRSEKILLVLNRSDSRAGISVQDIQRSVNHRVAAGIVSDGPVVTTSINRGVPFVISHREAQISQNLRDIARLFTAGDQVAMPAKVRRGFLARLFGQSGAAAVFARGDG